MWGIPTSGGNYYLPLTRRVTYRVERAPYRGIVRTSNPGVFFTPEQADGSGFTHSVVTEMMFRFENGNNLVRGLTRGSGRNPNQASSSARAWVWFAAGRGDSDVPGHVINARWGGPGNLPNEPGFGRYAQNAPFLNLFPLSRSHNSNRGDYNRYELLVDVRITQYRILCVRVILKYEGSEQLSRPAKFKWEFIMMDNQGNWTQELTNPEHSN